MIQQSHSWAYIQRGKNSNSKRYTQGLHWWLSGKDTVSTVSPSISHEVMAPDAMIFDNFMDSVFYPYNLLLFLVEYFEL